jgi:GT2 family glycosyltransferase
VAVISAVIPVHHRLEFFDETLISVFSQTRVPDEVLIVPDCSAAPEEAYFAEYPPPGPVKIIPTDRRRNVAGARNWGWKQAKGDFIAFNDSDDIWEPDKTRAQAEYLEAHPEVDGVYGPMLAFFPDGRSQPWAHDRPPVVDAATALIDANMSAQTLMIRRQALEKLGGFDETLKILEDQAFNIDIGLSGLRVVFLDSAVVTRLRRNDKNTSSNATSYFRSECQIALRYRHVSAQIYGPGSVLVHLSRALKRFGRKIRYMGLPTRLLSSLIAASAPASRMPRL